MCIRDRAAEKAQATLDDALAVYLTGTLEPAQKAYNEHYVCDYPLGLAGPVSYTHLDVYKSKAPELPPPAAVPRGRDSVAY